ncbi:MAG: transketolase C-terminal domain-containing protein [bacterium]
MTEKYSLRGHYGKLLTEAGRKYPNIVVLDADLAKSTKTEQFKKEFPGRFFDMGVAEADMMATAAGLASTGKNVFCSTFAIFASGRAWDQVRNSIAYPGWPVKIIVTHGGISLGEDGASHQANEDIALMKVIPGMTVVVPSDIVMLEGLFNEIIDFDSYIYVRLPRIKLPLVHSEDTKFEIGKGIELKEGRDITIIASGSMVHQANNTLRRFKSLDIDAGLVDMFTVKPLDRELLTRIAARTKGILVCEEHQMHGGLADSIASALGEIHPLPLERIGIEDSFGESGTPAQLFKKYKLDEESIIEKGKKLYDRIS